MAVIYDTTMTPGKLELLAAWLPAQPWYLDRGREPELARAGGFRLDDPLGEVGIEFMVVADGFGDQVTAYQVPMTYRSRVLPGADGALIGTSEHGVLGARWIYDGPRDPVLVAQLAALLQGAAEPQAQSVSHTPDPTVIAEPVLDGSMAATGSVAVADGPSGTDLRVGTVSAGGARRGQLVLRLNRVLRPWSDAAPAGSGPAGSGPAGSGQAGLSGTWRLPDGTRVRGVLATARAETP